MSGRVSKLLRSTSVATGVKVSRLKKGYRRQNAMDRTITVRGLKASLKGIDVKR